VLRTPGTFKITWKDFPCFTRIIDKLSSTYNTLAFNPLSVDKSRDFCSSKGWRASKKHIHKTAEAKSLYISRFSSPISTPSGRRVIRSSFEGRQVEFISTKPGETAGANHELHPITRIVTPMGLPKPSNSAGWRSLLSR